MVLLRLAMLAGKLPDAGNNHLGRLVEAMLADEKPGHAQMVPMMELRRRHSTMQEGRHKGIVSQVAHLRVPPPVRKARAGMWSRHRCHRYPGARSHALRAREGWHSPDLPPAGRHQSTLPAPGGVTLDAPR